MSPEQINQTLETIKTMNFNVDSLTLVQVVEQIKPILWFYLIKDLIIGIISWLGLILGVFLVIKAILKVINLNHKK